MGDLKVLEEKRAPRSAAKRKVATEGQQNAASHLLDELRLSATVKGWAQYKPTEKNG